LALKKPSLLSSSIFNLLAEIKAISKPENIAEKSNEKSMIRKSA
jgi:hypothetical protein